MNKYQRAYEEMHRIFRRVRYSIDISGTMPLKELVDRATPFKPMPTKDPWPKIIDIDFGKCACGQRVNTTLRFCDQCGQALDWRDYYKR